MPNTKDKKTCFIITPIGASDSATGPMSRFSTK